MSSHDAIGDFLTRIRNASRAGQQTVELKGSNLLQRLAELLRDEGYIAAVKVVKEAPQKVLKITLRYDNRRKPVFSTLKRVSRPSRRVYVNATEVKPVLGGLGTAIISTPQGLLTDRQARQTTLGGEILCEVW